MFTCYCIWRETTVNLLIIWSNSLNTISDWFRMSPTLNPLDVAAPLYMDYIYFSFCHSLSFGERPLELWDSDSLALHQMRRETLVISVMWPWLLIGRWVLDMNADWSSATFETWHKTFDILGFNVHTGHYIIHKYNIEKIESCFTG